MFQENSNANFQRCVKDVQGIFKGVSRKIEGCSEIPLKVIQGSFKVSKSNSMGIGSFKYALRKFQGWLKKVSSVFRENVTKSFKGVSKKFLSSFVFAILLLHGSHRSYPSRRRACFKNI